jgi:hypothetical protein
MKFSYVPLVVIILVENGDVKAAPAGLHAVGVALRVGVIQLVG